MSGTRPRFSAYMDGIGWGEPANDDGSGTALVMELARIFSGADVQTDRSIRFILRNNEESGLNGSSAYVAQRQKLQGREDPQNERGTQIGNGWDPHWHQPTDLYSTFSDKDFQLGLNAAQTSLAATAQLSGATLKK